MAQKFANAARGLLSAGINNSTTTIEITEGGSLFPVANTTDWFHCVLQDATGIEIVRVNTHSAGSNTFTVVRGQGGTTARSFALGSVFGQRVTAADMEDRAAKSEDNTFAAPQVVSVNSTSDALRITQTGTGNALVVEDSASPDSSPFVVDAGGKVVINATQAYNTGSVVSQLQVHGDSTGAPSIGSTVWHASVTFQPRLEQSKSRGTVGVHAAVLNNDGLGQWRMFGSDGTAFVEAASIQGAVDGTPGAGSMPGRLIFGTTPTGSGTPVEALRITSGQGIQIARTAVTSPAASDGNVFSGTYTPTLTNTTNVAASTAFACQYMRVGNTVTVSGAVAIDPTTTGATLLGMSLPIASAFAGSNNAGGTAVESDTSRPARIYADTANARLAIAFNAADVANRTWSFSVTYRVI